MHSNKGEYGWLGLNGNKYSLSDIKLYHCDDCYNINKTIQIHRIAILNSEILIRYVVYFANK